MSVDVDPRDDADAALEQTTAQQLDIDGRLHDIAPRNERLRLFEPDTQLDGQTFIDLD